MSKHSFLKLKNGKEEMRRGGEKKAEEEKGREMKRKEVYKNSPF